MIKKNKSSNDIDKELEQASFTDFALDKAVFVNEKWQLEKSYPLNIRLNKGILAEAKAIAKEKGVPYQTLLKIYIADGVRNDKKVLSNF